MGDFKYKRVGQTATYRTEIFDNKFKKLLDGLINKTV